MFSQYASVINSLLRKSMDHDATLYLNIIKSFEDKYGTICIYAVNIYVNTIFITMRMHLSSSIPCI